VTEADIDHMDLSKVLGDVYAGNGSTTTQTVPEWADDAHLDEAFASWTPGPPPEAPAAEREMAMHSDPMSRRRIDDDLAAALTEALTASSADSDAVLADAPESDHDLVAELLPEPAPEPARGWTRGDDDVLPQREASRSRGRRFARR
jgi:hypothetical protein